MTDELASLEQEACSSSHVFDQVHSNKNFKGYWGSINIVIVRETPHLVRCRTNVGAIRVRFLAADRDTRYQHGRYSNFTLLREGTSYLLTWLQLDRDSSTGIRNAIAWPCVRADVFNLLWATPFRPNLRVQPRKPIDPTIVYCRIVSASAARVYRSQSCSMDSSSCAECRSSEVGIVPDTRCPTPKNN